MLLKPFVFGSVVVLQLPATQDQLLLSIPQFYYVYIKYVIIIFYSFGLIKFAPESE